MPTKHRLFLIDGMAIAYRSYYAFINRPLINSKGLNTSPVFGFVNFLNKILEDEKPDYIGVIFDTREPTFRHQAYAKYKATRQKMPEDMAEMMEKLKEVVRAFNVPVVELPGYEADDVIGTLAKRAEKENVDTFLVTGDKDFMQLVSKNIRMYRPGKQGDEAEIIDEDGVMQRFGVPPSQVTEILGLTGDSSDNIPGVPGIGPKTAEPLVTKYGTIENLLERLDEIPQKGLQEKLRANKDIALLSKKLVTIDTRCPIEIDFHTLRAQKKDAARLYELYDELEFRSLAKKLREETTGIAEAQGFPSTGATSLADETTTPHEYVVIDSDSSYLRFLSELRKSKEFVFEIVMTSTNTLEARIAGISFSLQPHQAYHLPVEAIPFEKSTGPLFGNKAPEKPGFDLARIIRDLKPVFENEVISKYGYDLKSSLLALLREGVQTKGIEFDTMVGGYVLRPDGQHDPISLAREYLSYNLMSTEGSTGGKKKEAAGAPERNAARFSMEKADITFQLANVLHDKLASQGMKDLCSKIEFPLIEVLADMEYTGIRIDVRFLSSMSKELERQLDNLVRDIFRDAGEKFNVNSTQQLARVLFDKLKLAPVRKTKTGFSTDVGVLEALRGEHPIVGRLLEYRQLAKLKSTYVDALPKLIRKETGRVHTSFNQTVAATGRLSSSDPNLQNIPIRTEIGREIRRAFIPGGKGMQILSADYSQIELRVMAHISGDEGLLGAFRAHEDIHSSTASKIFAVKPTDVTRDMRRKAKEVNFGIMYGIGAYGLASRLEISQAEAKEIITKYFERFPKVNSYIAETIASARTDGFVATLMERRRYLPEVRSRNANVRGNAERQAINMPIQGTAADMIKLAMIRIHSALKKKGLRSNMLLQVHDELVFEVLDEEREEVKALVEKNMKHALELSLPVEVEIGIGRNWLEAH